MPKLLGLLVLGIGRAGSPIKSLHTLPHSSRRMLFTSERAEAMRRSSFPAQLSISSQFFPREAWSSEASRAKSRSLSAFHLETAAEKSGLASSSSAIFRETSSPYVRAKSLRLANSAASLMLSQKSSSCLVEMTDAPGSMSSESPDSLMSLPANA